MRWYAVVMCALLYLAGCANSSSSTKIGHSSSNGPMGEPVRDVAAFGFVTQVAPEEKVINIKHAPIPELNWAPMLMSFDVVEGIDLAQFKRGDKVQFVLEVDKDKNYRIKTIAAKDDE